MAKAHGGKTYEMMWDCPFCGTQKLLGKTHRHCPNCGAAQDPALRYFPTEAEKVAVEDHQFVGRDKVCPNCNGLNAAPAEFCGNCGASQEKAMPAELVTEGDLAVAANAVSPQSAAAVPANALTRTGAGSRVPFALAIIAVLVAGGIFLFTRTQAQTVTAVDHAWEREIRVEQFQRARDTAWQDQVPSAAYDSTCQRRQRDTRRIPDGETCRTVRTDNGDGTFTEREQCQTNYREEPIYDQWCTFNINRWDYERSVTTTGDSLAIAPVWGAVSLDCTASRLGCEREADRQERYSVTFQGDGETYTCVYGLREWLDIPVESTWTIEVRQFGGGAVCDSLVPAG